MMLRSFLPKIEQRYVVVGSAAGAILPLCFYGFSIWAKGGVSFAEWAFQNPSQFTLAAMPVWSGLVALQFARARRLRMKEAATRRLKERHLLHAASHDHLTGLANRGALQRKSPLMLSSKTPFAVLLLDLDRFKLVNDTMGHKAGDMLLQSFAWRLRSLEGNGVSVFRLGGDEFVLFCENFTDEASLAALAGRVEALVREPFVLPTGSATVGVSIGIASSPSGDESVDLLMQHADLALYSAKDTAGSAHAFYDRALAEASLSRMEIERDLARAIEDDALTLEFQPILSAENGEVRAMEALVRWHHPEKGAIMPERFLPVAKRCGLMPKLDTWALRNACAEAVKWPSNVGVSVNVSREQFEEETFVARVVGCLDCSGLLPSRLTIEISEEIIALDEACVRGKLEQLRALGVRVALDDFGVGLSSLNRLGDLHLDQLKLERSFAAGILSGAKGAGLMEVMLQFGSALKVATAIEGIEDERQMDFVRKRGASEVQGFLFSKPVPAAEVAQYLSGSGDGEGFAAA